MNQLARLNATMSSSEIAQLTGKRHDNVMRDIRLMLIDLYGVGGVLNFEDTLPNGQNGQSYPCFRLPKRESLILVSGYSVAMRARIIDRWQELESGAQSFQVPQTMSQALRLAADLSDENATLKADLAIAAPAVQAISRIADTSGSMCVTDTAKTLQVQPKRLFDWMSAHQWIYRRPGSAEWVAYQDKLQRGVMEHKVMTVHRGDGSEKVTTRVLVTAKGLTELAQKMERAA